MPIRQIQQISEQHCGPAVLSMLLETLGIMVDQESITRAAGVEAVIEEHGTRVDQLAMACARLAPQTQFWYKQFSTLDDIRYLHSRGLGVGVEWQGLFYDNEEDEDDEGDYGHYSIISQIDEARQAFIIVDPYKDFVNQDRIIPIQTFLRRWWDTNEIIDPFTNRKRLVEDVRTLFFVTPKQEPMPPERGFQAG